MSVLRNCILLVTSFYFTQSVTLLGGVQKALAAESIEFMCKSKAKEIAADTYKGCITEHKQAQIEQIRGEYQSKLAALRSHYNKELKQLSSKKTTAKSGGKRPESTRALIGEMPAKRLNTPSVKSEDILPDESSFSAGGYDSQSSAAPSPEIVEFPSEQE